jgi:aspartate oxidase
VSCADLRPLQAFRCGALRVETRGVVELATMWNLGEGAAAGISGKSIK